MTIQFDVIVRFSGACPLAAEIMAVRQADSFLRNKPIAEVREILKLALKDDWTYRFSPCSQQAAEEAADYLQAKGLSVSIV